jgi:hypothetical protein
MESKQPDLQRLLEQEGWEWLGNFSKFNFPHTYPDKDYNYLEDLRKQGKTVKVVETAYDNQGSMLQNALAVYVR